MRRRLHGTASRMPWWPRTRNAAERVSIIVAQRRLGVIVLNTRPRRWLFAATVLCIVVALMFALGERVRTSARAQLERELHAQFNSQMLCRGEVDGDICLDSANLGRCLSGEYIDYRTVWKRVHGEDEVRDLLQAKLDELGSPRRLSNWLACQGFTVFYDFPPMTPQPPGRLALVVQVRWINGFSAFTLTRYPFPLKYFAEPAKAAFAIRIQNMTILPMNITGTTVFN